MKGNADLHSKGFSTACKRAGEVTLSLMEDQNVVLEVKVFGVALLTALSRALKHAPLPRVNGLFVLLQKPGIVEDLLALITWQGFCKQEKIKAQNCKVILINQIECMYLGVQSFCAFDTLTKFFL